MSQIRFLSTLGAHPDPLETVQVLDLEDDGESGGDWITRLLSSGLFRHLPPENSHRFFAELEAVYVRAGEVVVKQGEPGDHFYVITQGHCAVTRQVRSSNREIQLHVLKEGDAFGEAALISRAPRTTTVRMLSDGALVRLERKRFEELVVAPMLSPVSYEQARRLIDLGALWLDVRAQDQRSGHVFDGSLNTPSHVLSIEAAKLDRTRTYVVYCESGTHSSTGAFLLTRLGFDAHVLRGGLTQMRSDADAAAREAAQGPVSQAQDEPQEAPALNTRTVDGRLRGGPGAEFDAERPGGEGTMGVRRTTAGIAAEEDRATAAAGHAEEHARAATQRNSELKRLLGVEQDKRESVERQLETERNRFLRKLRSMHRKLRGVRQEGTRAVSRLGEICNSQALSLKTAAAHLERAREIAGCTERERARLERLLTEFGAKLASATEQIAETKARLFESDVKLSNTNEKLRDAQERLTETKAKLADSDANVSSTNDRLADANDRLTMTTLKLVDTAASHAKVQARLAQAEQELAESRKTLFDTERRLAGSDSSLATGDRELAATKAKLDKALAQNEAEAAARRAAEAALEIALAELQEHIQGLATLRGTLGVSSTRG